MEENATTSRPKPNRTPYENFNNLSSLKRIQELVIPKLKKSKIAYLDLEGSPAHVLQLTVYTNIEKYDKWDYIIHLAAMKRDRGKALKLLKPFIEDRERILWVMHSGIQDQATLMKDDIKLMFWMDIQLAMNFITKALAKGGKGEHIECGSFVKARRLFLGIDWSKEEEEREKDHKKKMQRSNWKSQNLSQEQINYARDDTRELAYIYEKLLERPDFEKVNKTISIEFKQFNVYRNKDALLEQVEKTIEAINDRAHGKSSIYFKPHATDNQILYPTEAFAIKEKEKGKEIKKTFGGVCKKVTNLSIDWDDDEKTLPGGIKDVSDHWSDSEEEIERVLPKQWRRRSEKVKKVNKINEAKEEPTKQAKENTKQPIKTPKTSILGEAPNTLEINKPPILDHDGAYLDRHIYFSREMILREISLGHVEIGGRALKHMSIHPAAHKAVFGTVEYQLALKVLARVEKYEVARQGAYWQAVRKHGAVNGWYFWGGGGGVGLTDDETSSEEEGGIWSWSAEKSRRKKIKREMEIFDENY